MSRGFKGRGLDLKVSDTKDFPNFLESVAGDGDAAVDGGIELKIVAAGAARGEGAHTI
jgi:hypothetical protein